MFARAMRQEVPLSSSADSLAQAQKPRSRRSPKRVPRGITIGAHGHEVLALLYRYGALTRGQIMRLTGLGRSTASRQIGYLTRGGLVAQTRDVALWQTGRNGRPQTVHYLTAPSGARAGARELGVENDVVAVRGYRRVGVLHSAAHRVLANEYLISIRDMTPSPDVKVPAEEIHSEANPAFPLFGVATAKTDRRDTTYRFTRIVPDGAFVFFVGEDSAEGSGQRYYLELETSKNIRSVAVAEKVRDYAGRWRRLLSPREGEKKFHNPAARLEPVVILCQKSGQAASLQRTLRERLPEMEEWTEAAEVVGEHSVGVKVDARQLVLLTDWEDVREDPLGRAYRPLRKYPEDSGGWFVGLQDAATVAARVRPRSKEESG